MTIRVFLENNDKITVVDNNVSVIGATGGTQRVVMAAGVTGLLADANVERFDLSGNLADYRLIAIAGVGLQIQDAAGVVITTIPSINGTAGLTVAFANGSAVLTQTGGSAFALGGTLVSTTTAAAVAATLNTTDLSISAAATTVVNTTSQTFTLTTGADSGAAFTGGTGNDTFNAQVGLVLNGTNGTMVAVDTMQTVDVIAGGAGVDTLNFTTIGTFALPQLTSIEIINAQSLAALNIDTTAVAGVTNLNVIKAVSTVTAVAASTTDITVALEENGTASALNNTVNAGKNVTVTASKQGTAAASNPDGITIGGTTAATGDVVVNSTGAAYTASTAASTFGTIAVTGGKTISVTEKASSDVTAAAADTTNVVITQGAVTANANADTTTVTIVQEAAVTAKNAAFTTGGVTESASVKFSALTAGQTIVMGGLTFTAPAALTAAEAASSFANLVNGAAYGSLVPAGDTQGSGLATKGTYTGQFSGWTSSAVSGDTVVFTSTTARTSVTDIANTGAGTVVVTTTEGKAHDATATGGAIGVAAGQVTVANGAVLKTVTVNGFSATGSAITGANTVLETLSLSNGGAFATATAAATLTLNLEKVTGLYTQTAGATTLNVNSMGANTAGLAAANTTALNVSGTGLLNASASSSLVAVKTLTVTGTAGLNLGTTTMTALESVTTTGTTGTVTVAVDGTKAVYTGGAGVDNVTVTDAGTAVGKIISLGLGNDKLTLVGATVVAPTVALTGGDGSDTLSLDVASAVLLGAAFAAKVSGFEALELTGATGIQPVDVAALGNYNDITVTAGGAAAATLTLNNLSSGATIRLNDAVNAINATDAIVAVITGALANLTDVLNVAISAPLTADVTADGHGSITAANVETINVSVTDTLIQTPTNAAADTQNLTLIADKATTVNLTGDTALVLTLTTSTKVAAINASTATGALTVDLTAQNGVAVTVTGGAGKDVLSATVGTNAKADVLIGGAGDDTLAAGTNSATLTGGLGNDLFVLGAASATSGNKEANTYSTITDFAAGDLLQLSAFTAASGAVASFAKLTAVLNPATAVFSNYVTAAMQQAAATTGGTAGDSVWFSVGSDSYVVIDSGTETTGAFTNGEDLVIKLTGVSLDNVSFNSTAGTIALV